jgi:hypothetical protein
VRESRRPLIKASAWKCAGNQACDLSGGVVDQQWQVGGGDEFQVAQASTIGLSPSHRRWLGWPIDDKSSPTQTAQERRNVLDSVGAGRQSDQKIPLILLQVRAHQLVGGDETLRHLF